MSYTPIEKMNKKEKKKLHAAKRGTWGTLNPATRTPPNPKAYKRKKPGTRELDSE